MLIRYTGPHDQGVDIPLLGVFGCGSGLDGASPNPFPVDDPGAAVALMRQAHFEPADDEATAALAAANAVPEPAYVPPTPEQLADALGAGDDHDPALEA